MQTKGSIGGGDGGALLFSIGMGEEGMLGWEWDVVRRGEDGIDGSDIEDRARCCVLLLLDRTKFLSAGRIVLEI